MLRPLITALFCILTTASLFAHETAEELVASRTRADVNYRQMMETMGSAAAMITEGIIRQNPLTVQRGVEMIDNHPAPNHKPWAIVGPTDQPEFKRTLIAYDQLLHTRTGHIVRAAAQQNWQEANRAASTLFETCIACHATWKHRVRPLN